MSDKIIEKIVAARDWPYGTKKGEEFKKNRVVWYGAKLGDILYDSDIEKLAASGWITVTYKEQGLRKKIKDTLAYHHNKYSSAEAWREGITDAILHIVKEYYLGRVNYELGRNLWPNSEMSLVMSQLIKIQKHLAGEERKD